MSRRRSRNCIERPHKYIVRLFVIIVYGDFNHRDVRGRVRLDTVGSEEDLRKVRVALTPGLRVTVYDDSYQAEGIMEFVEGTWRARILWETGKDIDP